ncbi:glycosyltransferase [Gluconacetobacter sacchari]|uniref:Glycosyl transferase n=2 Tax=Gluconacetobacter sacchari TaxID=92759 RepID=A0A7W4NNZ3_9PROT|nr:glycosyltransferase [Gluconacetobacter sacchari]MBB2158788.1 glycosyl transferase [Gluconacetobacter sacchari]GBQ23954.1 glycosyltransferase [Gluconacetobacter sacchari DSM 12717]
MTIPAHIHFCWIGPRLPWAYAFAVLSAAATGGMDAVILHHTDTLEDGPQKRALEAAPGVILSRVDPRRDLAAVEQAAGLPADSLVALYEGVRTPVQRADILRAAILYRDGGVYLDMDTLTTASLRPLLASGPFVGTERIVWPAHVRATRSPTLRARHIGLSLLRQACRVVPGGWRGFRRIDFLYPLGLNNAVMGAPAGAPWLHACLRAMLALSPQERLRPYALGPHLLQRVAEQMGTDGLTVHDPAVFYPVPPEISEHIFRANRRIRAEDILLPGTRVVHWYASVRTRARIPRLTPAHVRAHCGREYYSALVRATIPDLPADGDPG